MGPHFGRSHLGPIIKDRAQRSMATFMTPSKLYTALNPRYQDTFKKITLQKRCMARSTVRSNAMQDLPAGNARRFLEFYAATKSRHEAYREHRPAEAQALLRAFELVLSSSWDISIIIVEYIDCVMLDS